MESSQSLNTDQVSSDPGESLKAAYTVLAKKSQSLNTDQVSSDESFVVKMGGAADTVKQSQSLIQIR